MSAARLPRWMHSPLQWNTGHPRLPIMNATPAGYSLARISKKTIIKVDPMTHEACGDKIDRASVITCLRHLMEPTSSSGQVT